MGDLAVNAPDCEVHTGEPPGGVVRLLTIYADVSDPAAVSRDELLRLHEHSGGTAAGIVHPPFVRLDHLDKQPDDATRGVELAALLALGACKLREEVLIDTAEGVLGAALLVADTNVANEIDELAEPLFVKRWPGVVFRQ